MGNPYLRPNPGYGQMQNGMAPTIGGQVAPDNQTLAQVLRSMGQQPQGNVQGLGGNLGAAALLTLADQMRGQTHLRKPQQMNVGFPSVTPGGGLAPVSGALPDVSY